MSIRPHPIYENVPYGTCTRLSDADTLAPEPQLHREEESMMSFGRVHRKASVERLTGKHLPEESQTRAKG
jgi:hypothetical protein